jgi:P27 family predicted phage terminase small subunit
MTAAKSEEQRRLEGYPDHRPPRSAVLIGGRINPDELSTVRRPGGLSPVEARAWRDIIAPLIAGGMLDRVDLTIVEIAAQALARVRQARAVIKAEGIFAPPGTNSQGRVASPAIAIEKGAMTEFRLLAGVLGIGPGSRVKLAGDAGAGSLRTQQEGGMAGELGRQLPPRGRLRVVGDDADPD